MKTKIALVLAAVLAAGCSGATLETADSGPKTTGSECPCEYSDVQQVQAVCGTPGGYVCTGCPDQQVPAVMPAGCVKKETLPSVPAGATVWCCN